MKPQKGSYIYLEMFDVSVNNYNPHGFSPRGRWVATYHDNKKALVFKSILKHILKNIDHGSGLFMRIRFCPLAKDCTHQPYGNGFITIPQIAISVSYKSNRGKAIMFHSTFCTL